MSNAYTEKEMRDSVVTVLRESKSDDHDTLRAQHLAIPNSHSTVLTRYIAYLDPALGNNEEGFQEPRTWSALQAHSPPNHIHWK